MPPRKRARARASQATSPAATSNPKTPTDAEESADDHKLDDAWTDGEEIGLFKGLMTWKPTGIHKHFRLMALHSFLLTNHYIHPANAHTKPPGIWRKLQTLYDLDALDEREDARQLSHLSFDHEDNEDEGRDDATDVYSEAENKIHREDFELPDEEFRERKWKARFPPRQEREDSPTELPELNMAKDAPVRFTPSFSVEPEDHATPAARSGRSRGAKADAKKGKTAPAESKTSKRRSARQAEAEPEPEEEAGDDEEGGEGEESGGEEAEESEASSAPAKATRGGRARGRGGTRGRGRGRKK